MRAKVSACFMQNQTVSARYSVDTCKYSINVCGIKKSLDRINQYHSYYYSISSSTTSSTTTFANRTHSHTVSLALTVPQHLTLVLIVISVAPAEDFCQRRKFLLVKMTAPSCRPISTGACFSYVGKSNQPCIKFKVRLAWSSRAHIFLCL